MDKVRYNSLIKKVFDKTIELYDPISDLIEDNGVINIKTKIGEYVINKQPSVFQLWMSSPLSGPTKYKMCKNNFRNIKDNRMYLDVIEDEVKKIKDFQEYE